MKNILFFLLLVSTIQAMGQEIVPEINDIIKVDGAKDPNVRLSALSAVPPRVRVAYVIASNRSAQPNAVENIQYMVMLAQSWYKENMKLNGFGEKTFVYENDINTNKPKVYIVNSNKTDTYLRGNNNYDVYNRAVQAAQESGLSVGAQNEVWLILSESHLMNSDGTVVGSCALGGGGAGNAGGMCVVGSDWLAFFGKLTDDTPYNGQILPGLGPYPMIYNTTYGSGDGSTFSSAASSFMGGVCHEMGHAFGLPHDYRNDATRNGNVMGNGFRGLRGSLYPAYYPEEHMRLEYAAALFLNSSQKFNRNKQATANPTVSISTSSPATLSNGLLTISFTASDTDTLAAAFLRFDGNTVSEMPLNVTGISSQFVTPYFELSAVKEYKVVVLDKQGNINEANVNLTVQQGNGNQAPKPAVFIYEPSPNKSTTIFFKSSATSDANDAIGTLQVQWDINNDGVYDTGWLNAANDYSTSYANEGNYLVRMKVKDPSGAEVASTPVSLRVSAATGSCRYIMPPIIMSDTTVSSITLVAKGCPGTVRWSDGVAGAQRVISRPNTITYTASCELPYNCMKTYSTACTPTYSAGCNGFGIGLNGVYIGSATLSSNTGCSTGAYRLFTSPIIDLTAGQTYNFALAYLGNSNGIQASIWLDWTNNGTSVKLFSTTAITTGSLVGSFTIPAGIPSLTATKLRVVTNFNSTPTEPCGSYVYGETEDYLVNIINPCPAGLLIESPPAANGIDYSSSPPVILRQANATNGEVIATNKVTGTANVTYEAAKVTLSPGFQANAGATFKAQTGGCN